MLIMVTGGSGSGKSEFAERCCMELCPEEKIYIATMQPFGKEGAARIQRHKKLRAGKHFQTIECYTDLEKLVLKQQLSEKFLWDTAGETITGDSCLEATGRPEYITGKRVETTSSQNVIETTTLLECLSNLTANEMFTNGLNEKQTVEKILSGIRHLQRQTKHLVVVTNDVFCDGISYEQETVQYMKALGEANVQLAAMADIVCEVVCGIPIFLKSDKMESNRIENSLQTEKKIAHKYSVAGMKQQHCSSKKEF